VGTAELQLDVATVELEWPNLGPCRQSSNKKCAVPGSTQRAAWERGHANLFALADPSACVIRLLCKLGHELEEGRRLSDEQPHSRQELHDPHSDSPRFGRANNRAAGKLAADERARLGHDQVGLKGLPTERGRVQIWECDGYSGDGVLYVR